MSYLNNAIKTSQSQPILGKDMVENNAGGYVFEASDWNKLERFLIIGTEGGSYYATEQSLTRQSMETVIKLLKEDGVRVVNRTVEVSDQGLATKNDPALLVLALAAASDDLNVRKAALNALPKVARTGTHLFQFVEFVKSYRGFGRKLREALANWYTERSIDSLALQVIKYQQRNGWTHKDVMRLAHPKTSDAERNKIFQWAVGKADNLDEVHAQIRATEQIKTATVSEAISLIREYRLPREVIPTEMLNEKAVWEALLQDMPIMAMVRSLAKMSTVGIIEPFSDGLDMVLSKISNEEVIRSSRMHPMQFLIAGRTYGSGQGVKGKLTWKPNSNVVDALDAAFYTAFKNVEPTNMSNLIALDVSGSMTWGNVQGVPNLTSRDVSAAMSLVAASVEPNNCHFVGFSHELVPLDISPKMRINDVIKTIEKVNMGGTDCSLPMVYAMKNKYKVDAFTVWTDNETWFGNLHPSEALVQYRKVMNRDAKLAVAGVVANDFSIADPNDKGMMDFVGFSSETPQVMSKFFRGEI